MSGDILASGGRRPREPAQHLAPAANDRLAREADAPRSPVLVFTAALLLLAPSSAPAGIVALPLGPVAARARELAAAEVPALTDPAELAKRIGENVRKANEGLRAKDTAAGTRRAQEQVLRDLDVLLNPPTPPNPPPSSPPPSSPPPMPPDNPPPMPPMGGQGSPPPPMPPMPPMGGGRPMPPKSWRDQAGDDAPMPMGPMPTAPMGEGEPPPMPPMAKGARPMPTPMGEPKEPGEGSDGVPPPPKSKAVPPPEDAVAKQVWGHLPERVRRQANQYYREQFMPKYAELLKRYYTGLAESPAGAAGRRPSPEPRSP